MDPEVIMVLSRIAWLIYSLTSFVQGLLLVLKIHVMLVYSVKEVLF